MLIDSTLSLNSPHHQLHVILALGKPWHRVAVDDAGQQLSVVLPFLAQFCRQLRIFSSVKLLNAADLTLCFQNKDHIVCIPVVQEYLLSKGRNNHRKYLLEIILFAFSRRRLALKARFWSNDKYLASLSDFAPSIKGSSKLLSTLILKDGETNTFGNTYINLKDAEATYFWNKRKLIIVRSWRNVDWKVTSTHPLFASRCITKNGETPTP